MKTSNQTPPGSFPLLRFFAVTGFAAFLLVAAVLVWFEHTEARFFTRIQEEQNAFFAAAQESSLKRHAESSRRDLLSTHEAGHVTLAQLFANTLWESAFSPLVAQAERIPLDECRAIADVKDAAGKLVQPAEKKTCFAAVGRRIVALPGFRSLDAKVFGAVKNSAVFKIKVYDLRGLTVYSSERAQIGEDKSGNAGWQSAVKGEPASELTHRDKFSAFEGVVENRDLISSYVPLRLAGSDRILGVFEIYYDVSDFVAGLNAGAEQTARADAAVRAEAQRATAENQRGIDAYATLRFIVVIAALALLYVALLLVVRHGERITEREKRERRLSEQSRDRLAAIVENANDAIISRSLDGMVLSWNSGAERMLGYSAAEAVGQNIQTLIHVPEASERIAQNIERVRRGESVEPYETRRRTKDGRVIDVMASVSPIRNDAGEIVAASIILHDISPIRRAESALRESEERFRAAFEHAGVGMGLRGIDPRNPRWLRVNDKLCEIFGYTREELLKLTTVDLTPPGEQQVAIDYNERLLRGELTTYSREKRYVRKDGTAIWTNITLSTVKSSDGPPSHIISVIEDITERKRAEERLQYLAQYDTLTGLPNRSLLQDRLASAIARARRGERLLALMLLDLDRFNEINVTLGYATGDRVLKAVAERLGSALREVDTIARLGGDEFVIVVENVRHVDDATAMAERVEQALLAPIVVDGRDIFVTASVGITIYPFAAENVDALLQAADIAMYRAKEEGRNTYEFYAPEMNAHAAEDLEMENLLRRALERNEFVLHYQPKVSVRTGRITGAEALIRWQSSKLGFVSPAKFIPLAEKTGLIAPISEWVIQTACADAKLWQTRGLPPIVVSANLSPRQFRQKNLVAGVAAALAASGLDPRCFELEITEGMIMHHPDAAIALLAELHGLGVRISLDDFGTGYSSLAYLQRFPVDTLKIDQSFIRELKADSDDARIVTAVVAMAKSLRLGVIAEGVETREQLAFLEKLDCDEYQGYYFSRPVPPEQFAGLLESTTRARTTA